MSLSLCAHDNPTERRNGPAGYKSYIIPAFVGTCIGNTRSYLSFLVLSSISTFYRFFFSFECFDDDYKRSFHFHFVLYFNLADIL